MRTGKLLALLWLRRWRIVVGCLVIATVLRLTLGADGAVDLPTAIAGALCVGTGLGVERWVSSQDPKGDPFIPFTRAGLRRAAPLLVLGVLLMAIAAVPVWA